MKKLMVISLTLLLASAVFAEHAPCVKASDGTLYARYKIDNKLNVPLTSYLKGEYGRSNVGTTNAKSIGPLPSGIGSISTKGDALSIAIKEGAAAQSNLNAVCATIAVGPIDCSRKTTGIITVAPDPVPSHQNGGTCTVSYE